MLVPFKSSAASCARWPPQKPQRAHPTHPPTQHTPPTRAVDAGPLKVLGRQQRPLEAPALALLGLRRARSELRLAHRLLRLVLSPALRWAAEGCIGSKGGGWGWGMGGRGIGGWGGIGGC